jgi:hypothetical protein
MNRILLAAAVAASSLSAALVVPGMSSASPSSAGTVGAHVAELRQVLAPYRDEATALADGYLRTDACTAGPLGGMGYHYVNPRLIGGPIDPAHPPIQHYRDGKNGSRVLPGGEFFAVDADQDTRTDGDRPSLWGQPFNGPMLGHEAGMPVHYDLHVWTDFANPNGVLEPWSPKVSC